MPWLWGHTAHCLASTSPLIQVHRAAPPTGAAFPLASASLGRAPPHPLPFLTDPDDQYKLTEDTRQLGLVVCRGTSVVLICPQDGMEAIPNPFIQQQDA